MSVRDSATAQTDSDDLAIVGLSGGASSRRRINIGVVNVGQIPGTFRITFTRRDGKRIGGHFEIGLAEDESHLQTDIESTIGAEIDEDTTVHVRVIAGTCLAYATIVDASGNNQFVPAVPSPHP
jgi:hypothetical protein